MKSILVIVVTYNAMQWIEKCLTSILDSNYNADCIVIDNNSSDNTVQFIKDKFAGKIILIEKQKNLGFGGGNNIGIQYAIDNDYDYVYLLNQDAWIHQDTLRVLIETSIKYPDYGILSPMQFQDGANRLDQNFRMSLSRSTNDLLVDLLKNEPADVYDVPDVMAAHWLISRQCFEKVGGFSPTFTQYGEDNNYIDRARFHGFKTGIVPRAVAIHDRAKRQITKAMLLREFKTLWLVRLSDITQKTKISAIYVPVVKTSIKYRSFNPICSYFYIRKHLKEIESNAEISRKNCAFLSGKG